MGDLGKKMKWEVQDAWHILRTLRGTGPILIWYPFDFKEEWMIFIDDNIISEKYSCGHWSPCLYISP